MPMTIDAFEFAAVTNEEKNRAVALAIARAAGAAIDDTQDTVMTSMQQFEHIITAAAQHRIHLRYAGLDPLRVEVRIMPKG